mgnify:CR=1 FL=1
MTHILSQTLNVLHRATSLVFRHRLPLLVFGLFAIFETILGQALNTTWEWDAVTRSMQGYEIAAKGIGWYFSEGNGHYVWLPFWQLLMGFAYSFFHINTILIGEVASALCAGGTAVYVFVFLRKFGLDETQSILGSMMLLTFGHYVAYSSQAMTESLSVLLFFACLYHLYLYFDTGSLGNLGIASLASLVNVATRYEAWFFLALIIGFMFFSLRFSQNPRFRFVNVVHVVLFALPSITFIGLWLEYNLMMAGTIFGFRDWILAHNAHESLMFYKDWGYTLIVVLGNLFFALGTFWMSIIEQLKQLESRKRRIQDNMLVLFGLLFLGYIIYFAYSVFTGFNIGWPRHYLYFVPLSIIAFMLNKFEKKPASYVLLIFNIVLGIVAFAYNVQAHNLYAQSGQWPGDRP